MDAQNAAESISTKPPASSASLATQPKVASSSVEADHSARPVSSAPPVVKKPSSVPPPRPSSPHSKDNLKDNSKDKDKEPRHTTASSQHNGTTDRDDDTAGDNNSEAETIVLAGKDGSPVKSRKVIKREDTSDDDPRARGLDSHPRSKNSGTKPESSGPVEGADSSNNHALEAAKRKRLIDQQQRNKDSRSDSESTHAKMPKVSHKEREFREKDAASKPRPGGDRAVPHKRKAPRAESDDEADHEAHKVRRQRISSTIDVSASQRASQRERDFTKQSASSKIIHEPSLRHRSISPHPRNHRRSASTQVVSQSSSGLSQKKKRVPPPLTTDYFSDESSASGSPHIRSSTARGLVTPAIGESAMSTTKNTAHKKHVDAHGQTQLAKACSNGNYENVKKRLLERPEDLNLPDYAGNTPLQIAAINGHDEIVQYLVNAGCDIDCVNHDKDTPLLDAVDNGHLNVIKVLLNAGVNPRKANVNGQEPLDRVDDELDNADEIRAALIEARKKTGTTRRKTSEERPDHLDTHSSHGAPSPRRSPAAAEPASSSRRAASSRSHKLSNQALYIHMNDDRLFRAAAGRGDIETVERFLQVREQFDDPPSMVAAARGGHYEVINLLLAIGHANPDPQPIRAVPEDVATPILAAIGQENIKVIDLLLQQSNFDPTKKFKGETYFEIARKRQGPNWKEEEQMLKDAYDAYKKAHRDPSKKSPHRREQELKRSGRTETREESSKAPKRKVMSPTRDSVRGTSKPKTSDKEHKSSSAHATKSDDQTSPKRGPGRPKKDERGLPTIAISDGENSPPSAKASKSKRPVDPDVAALSSEGEAKPRRKLMSGRDLKEQREKNRRASMVSNSSSLREPSSPRETRHDESYELPTEKYHDRAKALKRDESRDRLSVTGEHTNKRSRTSATPDTAASEKEGEPVKKRRLEGDKKDRVPKPSSSPDRNRKLVSRESLGSSKHEDKPPRKIGDQLERRDSSKPRRTESVSDQNRGEHAKPTPSEKSIHVKSEDSDVVMRDAGAPQSDEAKLKAREEERKRRAEIEAKIEAKKREKEKEAEERKRREEEEKRQLEAKKRKEEEDEKKRIEEETRRRAEESRKKREEEEAQQRKEKEEAQQRKEKEEAEQREAAKIRREKEEEEQRKKEEERVRKEQEAAAAAAAAAEEARRKREEEERKEQERRAREVQRQRRMREEQEKKRLERLPAFLRWLDRSTRAATLELAKRWFVLRGVRMDSIRPELAGTSEGRELWILNTQVAMLFGESDIQLSRFSGWDRVPAPLPAKHLVLGLMSPKPALVSRDEWDLGREIPDYYFGKEPEMLSRSEVRQLMEESKTKFLALDLFFVKLSDVMSAVPHISHLRNLEIMVTFHEAAETMEKYDKLEHPSRWKDDPDAARYKGYSPRPKYFLNGQLVREGKVDMTSASFTPWPEVRVPRNGLAAIPSSDPNYARVAKEQGLEHLLSGLRTPPMLGAQTSPHRVFSQRAFGGLSPPQSESAATANGQARSSTSSTAGHDKPLVNGTTELTATETPANGSS